MQSLPFYLAALWFTKTSGRGSTKNVRTLVPAFYGILTHSRANKLGLLYRAAGIQLLSALASSPGCGTFDMRVFTNRMGLVVGKLHIPMYAQGMLLVRVCLPVCIELSQFRAVDQPRFSCYRIVRNASNSALTLLSLCLPPSDSFSLSRTLIMPFLVLLLPSSLMSCNSWRWSSSRFYQLFIILDLSNLVHLIFFRKKLS